MPRDPVAATAASVCPHDCPSVCSLEVDMVAPDRIGRVRGGLQPYTDGVICAKVSRYAERVHHPDRLMHPLRRVGPKGDGRFERIGWDEALDTVADAFRRATAEHGPEAVWPYYYAGTMGLVQRDGINRLRHVLGYSGMHGTFCSALSDAGWFAAVGARTGTDPMEMVHSDVIVLWGTNAVHTQVNVMNWVQKARKARGTKLVVVDAYRTATAEKADLHLMPRPGTDSALACAVMHVLFAEGFADRAWMAAHTDAPEALEAHVATRTPQWAEEITGIPADQIIAFARLYGGTKRSFVRAGYGFTRNRLGAVAMHAVACLPSVTGAWAHEGGGALYSASGSFGIDKTLIEGTDVKKPGVRVLDQSRIGPALMGEEGGPPVTAMLVQNTNPAVVAPNSAKVRQGLLREDLFLCVHEQFLTDTARYADIVLPATMFLEHDDIYVAGGHFHLQAHGPVLPVPGECRSNHEVICALAERLGAEHEGFRLTARQVIDRTLKASGYDISADDLIERGWIDCRPSGDRARFANGFPTRDGKFHFRPDWASIGPQAAGLPELPDWVPLTDAVSGDRPFRLVAAPARHFLNTSFTETPSSRKLEGQPTALVHPAVCADLGVAEGDTLRIGNDRGSVVVAVRPFDGLQRDTVVVESIWPNGAFAEGRGINTLVSAEAGRPNGGGVFHDTAVWLRAVSPGDVAEAALPALAGEAGE